MSCLSHKVVGDKTGSGAAGFGEKSSSITSLPASPKEISECLSGWLTYLQVISSYVTLVYCSLTVLQFQ